MRAVYTVILFIIGLFMGSFYNVVGYRLPNKMSLIKPNSHCTNCKKELKWYHLIPVFSYLFLGGKCAYCKSKIGIIHPLVELITGILFAISYYSFGFTWSFGIALIISSLNLPISCIGMLTIIATIIDPPATMLNVVGDSASSMLVSRIVDGKKWIQKGTD